MNLREVWRVDKQDFAKDAKSQIAFVKGTCLGMGVVTSVSLVK
jgi:hypothetical protein